MPLRNYCRDALVQHCIELSNGNEKRAAALLNRVVLEQRDFLVAFACQPIVHSRRHQQNIHLQQNHVSGSGTKWTTEKYIQAYFDAAGWVKNHLRGSIKAPGNLNYPQMLARAYLLSPGLEIPPELGLETSTDFLNALKQQASIIVTFHRQPPPIHNFEAVRAHSVFGAILQDIEETFPAEVLRCLALYDALVETIHNGIPPVPVVCQFLGGDGAAETYRELLDSLEEISDDLDVDYAVARGLARQQRSENTWNAVDAERMVDLLGIYVRGKQNGQEKMVIGETYGLYRAGETQRKNEAVAGKRQEASRFGVWRIRRSELLIWRKNMTPVEWRIYNQCERAMRENLAAGTYSQIPRRKFNEASLLHMKTHNLALLQDQFAIETIS